MPRMIPAAWMREFLLNRLRQGPLDGPAKFQPLKDGCYGNTSAPRPFVLWERFVAQGKKASLALIVTLFGPDRPSAVFVAIRSIVVDALQAVFTRWSRPHVSLERSKAAPFVAHDNAATSIVRIGRVFRVAASLTHIVPRRVFGCGTSHSCAVLQRDIFTRAAATCRRAILQGRCDYVALLAAIAATKVFCAGRSLGHAENGPAVETKPRQVFCWEGV